MVKKGGARPGAGRPMSVRALVERDISAEVMQSANIKKILQDLLNSKSEHIRLEAAKYLCDRVWGKPKQAVEVNGKNGGPIVLKVIYDGTDSTSSETA